MILLAIALAAEAGPDTFEGANTSLAAGDLAGAIEGYRALLEAGGRLGLLRGGPGGTSLPLDVRV